MVEPPTTEITIQELINFMREQEASFTGLAYDIIAEATGKFDLGGGTFTGIVVKLSPE